MGDFNITLNVGEHSSGRSNVDGDMEDFIDCINNIEDEDMCWTGMHFTWIKSPNRPYPFNAAKKAIASEVLDNYNVDVNDEVKLLYQMAKIDWLNEGNRNTAYFHKVVKSRKSKNMILSIKNKVGIVVEGDIFTTKLSNKEASFMITDVTDNEIKTAMFGINDLKDFFGNSKLLREVNSTLIALIPKVIEACNVTNYRLIACYNELLKGYNRKGGPKICSLKINIAKAYDTVNWDFLREILIRFGFHRKTVDWIYTYDLLVLCHGSIESAKVIKASLDQFSNVSGLKPNMSKSTIFFSNVDIGRVQLIASVLGSMHVYWASAFLLPMYVVKDIGKVLKGFLWTQGDMARGKAKIA
ncbi:hypothetical protein Tco_0211843 [Tanacetum coccineum]